MRSNNIMKELGFDLESENATTKTYVRQARAGVEVCCFIEGKDRPHFFWQRKRGMLKDTVVYDVYEDGMAVALASIKKEKKWEVNLRPSAAVRHKDEEEKIIIKEYLKKLRGELNESYSD